MIESILYNVGIYCRLSLDDGYVGESGSIQTQKMMLEKYCRDNHYTIKEEYIDEASDENGSTVSEALYYMYLWCRNI